jgi:hypothetical protein
LLLLVMIGPTGEGLELSPVLRRLKLPSKILVPKEPVRAILKGRKKSEPGIVAQSLLFFPIGTTRPR